MDLQIPEEIKKVATDPKLYDLIEKIGDRFGLHIDQMGELDVAVRRVLLGINKSKDFVKNITDSLEIDSSTANKIAEAVNTDLFQTIKSNLQSLSDTSNFSSLNQAGNFTVESQPVEPPMHVETPAEVIEGIENPAPAAPRAETMLVDHLLAGPIVSVEKKTEQKAPNAPQVESPKAPQPQPKKPSGPDLYREPIE